MSTASQPALIPSWTPAPAQLTMAYSVCRGITRANAKNFYYAFHVLPYRKRQALCAVYAFMRRCDDIADEPGLTPLERRRKLDTWLDSLHQAQQGHPSDDPVLMALTDFRNQAADEDEPLFAAGAFSPPAIHYQTFEDLKLYCYRVASVVGLVCIHIFGYRDPAAEPLAEQCGLAFQLTNIIRDVKEDAAMGRIYLPQEDLARFGLTAADVLSATDSSRLRPLLALEAKRAREGYAAGEQLIPYISEDSQPALWVLINIYRALLEKIAARQYEVFHGKISLTVFEKLRILAKGFLQRLT
jgi:15-cis-phytoene synthase